jgi:hypothetical protein
MKKTSFNSMTYVCIKLYGVHHTGFVDSRVKISSHPARTHITPSPRGTEHQIDRLRTAIVAGTALLLTVTTRYRVRRYYRTGSPRSHRHGHRRRLLQSRNTVDKKQPSTVRCWVVRRSASVTDTDARGSYRTLLGRHSAQ